MHEPHDRGTMSFVQPNDLAIDSLDFARAMHSPAYSGGGRNEGFGGILNESPSLFADVKTGIEGVPNKLLTLPPRVP